MTSIRERRGKGKLNLPISGDISNSTPASKKEGDLPLIDVGFKIQEVFPKVISPDQIKFGEQIGRGATSTVYKITINQTGEVYALKQIKYSDKSGELQNVVNELHCMNILRHKNVLRLYTAFYNAGYINIIMPIVNGASLHDYLKQIPKMSEAIVGRMAYHTIQGLHYLRRNHFLHRDLKPSNILLSLEGEVRIADFGMARQLTGSIEQAKSYLGTVSYMAPERLNNLPYSFKSDVWSLGLIILECVLGSFPLPKEPTKITFWDIMNFASNDVQVLLPEGFSPELSDFLSKCLKNNPNEREGIENLVNHPWVKFYESNQADRPLLEWIWACEAKRKEAMASNHLRLQEINPME